MKFSEKDQTSLSGGNQVLGVDFHDFIQKEQSANLVELASEFGVNVRTIKNLKKRFGPAKCDKYPQSALTFDVNVRMIIKYQTYYCNNQ